MNPGLLASQLGDGRWSVRMFDGPIAVGQIASRLKADVAQLVEQLIRNQQVTRSSRVVGSIKSISYSES